jgi:glycosyltransferase involved in cell wall biosynthesis
MVSMPEKLTVLRAITRLNIGGPAIHAILLTQGLQSERFRSVLVSGKEGPGEGSLLDMADRRGVRPVLVEELGREVSLVDDLAAVRRLYRLIRQVRPQIVHTHMAKAGTAGRVAARLAGVPLVLHTYHGHVFHSYFGPLKTAVFLNIERFLGRLTDCLIAVGHNQRQDLIRYRVASPEKIVSVPLGLEIESMLTADSERGRLRTELGLDCADRLVGIVARLVPIKAHEVFLQAADRVQRLVPRAHFLVVGDGERRAELERYAGQLGLGDTTFFLGWRRDMQAIYADLDAVVLSSLNEGSPVAIIEAMAAGRPVISTDVGGVSEVIESGRSGLLVPPRDAEALADAVTLVLSDPATAHRMGQAAREAVYPKYSSGRLIADLEQLYLSLARSKGLVAA